MFRLTTVSANKKQVRTLEERINEFSSIDHIDKIKTHFVPMFEKFGGKINHFYCRMDEMTDCIKRFDYNMNLKVNKS